MNEPTGQARDGKGRYIYTLEAAERDAEAARLRSQHFTYQQIADRLGYPDKAGAYRGIQAALKATVQEAADDVRQMELERLDRLARAAEEVMARQHATVSQGKIIYEGGEPLIDDAPVLQAIDRLLRIQERRARLLGLDAATKTQVSGGVRYEIVGVDMDQLK
ncbi:hypothetical protein [Streptomyces sp. NPDC053079]|uniref:hypothetical protein n=1 Tax=Streptomyces sp. NPDC053079 TaxID=3365697 RepID=UPI0037D05A71